jgi:cytochrome c oxidase subunit 4
MSTPDEPIRGSASGWAAGPRVRPTRKALVLTLLALLLLAGLSLVLSRVDLGSLAFPVALGIAVVKAVLVAIVFMEFLHEGPAVHIALAVAISLFGLLLVFLVADIVTRTIPPLAPPPGNAQRAVG